VPLELMLLVSRYTSFSLQRQTKTPPSGGRYRRRPTLNGDTSRRRIERTKLAPLSPTKDTPFRRSNGAGLAMPGACRSVAARTVSCISARSRLREVLSYRICSPIAASPLLGHTSPNIERETRRRRRACRLDLFGRSWICHRNILNPRDTSRTCRPTPERSRHRLRTHT